MRKTDWILIAISLILLVIRIYFNFYWTRTFKTGDLIRISSKVHSEPIRYDTSQYLKLKGLKIYLPLYPEISYGDTVIVEGRVEEDKLLHPKLIKLKENDNYLYTFRNKLLNFYNSGIPSPHSSLIAGMVIGSKSGIPADFWDKLKFTGTAHVVVASGMNITLVAGFLISFFTLFLKRRNALVLTFIGIWLYAVLSGFEAPIVRAAVMGTIAFTAQEFGKISQTVRTLLITVFIMIMAKPEWIIDVGFLLSFFATLSIVLFQKKLYKILKAVPEILREDFSTSLAAQVGVAPILYYSFGQFNILSPLINVLVLWTVPLITILGMIAGISGLAVPIFGKGIILLIFPLTAWFIFVIGIFS